jgi:hypothetical protein
MLNYQNKLKITHCIVSSDNDKNYYDFYPVIKKTWERLVGVKMIFIFIGEKIPKELECYEDDIYLLKPISGIPTSFMSRVVKMLFPSYIKPSDSRDLTIITSDIDLLPMRKSYFVDSIKDIDDNKFVKYQENCTALNQYNMTYNVAKADVWKQIFKPAHQPYDEIYKNL